MSWVRTSKRKGMGSGVLMTAILVLLMALAILMAMLFLRKESGVTLEKPAYQFFMTETTSLPKGTRLERGEDGIRISDNGDKLPGEVTPIYYEESEEFVLPVDFSWVNAANGQEWYVPAFSTIERDEAGMSYCQVGKKSVRLENGFLTDDTATVVFLAETRLSVNGDIFTLSPLSFYSGADNQIRIYDHASNTMTNYDPTQVQGASVAFFSGCRLDLGTLVFVDQNENPRLLVATPKVLRNIMEK